MPIKKQFRDRKESSKPATEKSYPPRREGVKKEFERKDVAPKADSRGDSRSVSPREENKEKYPPRAYDQTRRDKVKGAFGQRGTSIKKDSRSSARPTPAKAEARTTPSYVAPRTTPSKAAPRTTSANAAPRGERMEAAYRQAGVAAHNRHKPTSSVKPSPQAGPITPSPSPKAPHTHWGEVAEWYDKHVGDDGSEYHREVILPGVLRLLELDKIAAGKPRVLDIACGQGVLCRSLAKEGCQVTGIDAAAELISAAKRRNVTDHLSIDYRVGDATKIIEGIGKTADGLKAGSFDAVTIILSIQNMTPLSPLWHAVWALLKPKGSLVVVMMHPCFRIPQHSDWHWDERVKGQHRVVRQYLRSAEVSIETHPGDAANGLGSTTTTHFHRPLQAYINTMGNAGLFIDRLDEWTSHKTDQPGPKKVAMDKARQEIPLFMAMRARKM